MLYIFLSSPFYFITCTDVLPACVPLQHMCSWGPGRAEEGFRSPRPGVTDSCEHHVGAGILILVL